MTIHSKTEQGITTMQIEGRIDTNTSSQLQAEILKVFQSARTLVLDFSQVQYVSSAGLRALLIGQKTAASKGARMELVQVPEMVMSVLETVGFTKVLNIR